MDEIAKDERFKHIPTDSRFREMPKKDRKFKIDNRFKKMFHDKSFKLKYSVDKRGRPVNLTTNDNLKKFYELSESDENDETEDENKKEDSPKTEETKSSSIDSEEDDEVKFPKEAFEDSSKSESSSDSESSDSDDDDDDSSDESGVEDVEIPWNEFDKDTERSENISHRLAMCNMDWDRIKATDLFLLLNSFKPTNGIIKSVKIYLSDYGAERVAYESQNGPKELTEDSLSKNENNDSACVNNSEDDDDGDNFDRVKLRTYQFNRLKYYYAVVECDNAETANRIYTECDGMEYESSCTKLDLRFIPDEEVFDRSPSDSCTELPDPLTYKPNLFFTTALNQTKVECTWDETPRDRLAITMKKYTEEDLKNSSDFKRILASSDSESEEDENETKEGSENNEEQEDEDESEEDEDEKKMKKYRSLLFGMEEKSKSKRDSGLAFSWGDGDSAPSESDDEDNIVSQKKKDDKSSKHASKSNKKKALTEEEKKEEAQLSMLAMDNDEKPHFNLDELLLENDKIKKSKKKKKLLAEKNKSIKEDDFKLNISDPRFEAIYNNHKFNIDPSDQLYKKTKAMEELVSEKNKRKIEQADKKKNSLVAGNDDEDENSKKQKVDPGASLLVSSIKSKTEMLNKRKKEIKERQNKMKFAMNKR